MVVKKNCLFPHTPLTQVEVSSAELVKSGIGKIITELRRSQDVNISSRAQTLRAKWKAIVVSEYQMER